MQKLSIEDWHQLSEKKKEILRTWAVKRSIALDIIPSTTAETCDYAALLTHEQLQAFLTELHPQDDSQAVAQDYKHLWKTIQQYL